MSTTPNDDADSPRPHGEDTPDQPAAQRPQPRYGAYAPQGNGDAHTPDGESAPSHASDPYGEAPQSGSQHNPYGQPIWGQSGEAQPQSSQPGGWQSAGSPSGYQSPSNNPYGEPQHHGGWQQSNYHQPQNQQGGYAPQTYSAAERPKRPGTLWATLAALLAAGVTSLIWGIYVFVTLPTQSLEEVFGGAFSQTFVEEMERQSAQDPELQNLSAQEMEEVTLVGIALVALVWAFILLALYVTSAFLGSMAGNPGRILATIWAGLSVLFFFLGHDGISYGIIFATVALSIVAIVMMWLPSSSGYIRHRRWEKEVSRSGYYSDPAQ